MTDGVWVSGSFLFADPTNTLQLSTSGGWLSLNCSNPSNNVTGQIQLTGSGNAGLRVWSDNVQFASTITAATATTVDMQAGVLAPTFGMTGGVINLGCTVRSGAAFLGSISVNGPFPGQTLRIDTTNGNGLTTQFPNFHNWWGTVHLLGTGFARTIFPSGATFAEVNGFGAVLRVTALLAGLEGGIQIGFPVSTAGNLTIEPNVAVRVGHIDIGGGLLNMRAGLDGSFLVMQPNSNFTAVGANSGLSLGTGTNRLYVDGKNGDHCFNSNTGGGPSFNRVSFRDGIFTMYALASQLITSSADVRLLSDMTVIRIGQNLEWRCPLTDAGNVGTIDVLSYGILGASMAGALNLRLYDQSTVKRAFSATWTMTGTVTLPSNPGTVYFDFLGFGDITLPRLDSFTGTLALLTGSNGNLVITGGTTVVGPASTLQSDSTLRSFRFNNLVYQSGGLSMSTLNTRWTLQSGASLDIVPHTSPEGTVPSGFTWPANSG